MIAAKRSKVRVALIGFRRQRIVSADQVINGLTLLPDRHLAGLLCIKYHPDRDVRFAAWYDISQKGIEMFYFRDEWEFFDTMFHEIAHHVFYNTLTIDQRAEWVNAISRTEGHVSAYAKKNTHEDFAESYAQYVLNPAKLLVFPRKLTFLHHVVFAGYIPDASLLWECNIERSSG